MRRERACKRLWVDPLQVCVLKHQVPDILRGACAFPCLGLFTQLLASAPPMYHLVALAATKVDSCAVANEEHVPDESLVGYAVDEAPVVLFEGPNSAKPCCCYAVHAMRTATLSVELEHFHLF